MDITVGGDDQDIVFHERPEVMAIRTEPDLARLAPRSSTWTAWRIALQLMAVGAGAGLGRSHARGDGRQRLVGMTVMAAEGEDRSARGVGGRVSRRDVSMTDGMLWHRLVNERGWTHERFAAWLGRMWVDLLVQA